MEDRENLNQYLEVYADVSMSREERFILEIIKLAVEDGDRDYIRSSLFEKDLGAIRLRVLAKFLGISTKDVTVELCRELVLEQCKNNAERYSFGITLVKANKPKPKVVEHEHNKRKKKNIHTWIVIDPAGNETVVTNLVEFCKEHNLSANALRAIAYGHRKQHKGWKCRENK